MKLLVKEETKQKTKKVLLLWKKTTTCMILTFKSVRGEIERRPFTPFTSTIHPSPREPLYNGYLIRSTNGLSKPFKLVIMETINCETALGGGSR